MRVTWFRRGLAALAATAFLATTITCVPALGRLGRYLDVGYYVYEPDVIVVDEYVEDYVVYDDGYWSDWWWDGCC